MAQTAAAGGPPFQLKNGLEIRLKCKTGLKNKKGHPDWYLAIDGGKLIADGGIADHSEWVLKCVDEANQVYTINHKNGKNVLGINEQLQMISNADPNYSGKLKFFWQPNGKVCIMSVLYADKKNRAGGVGPHLGVDPKGELLGNAGRGDWGQFEMLLVSDSKGTTNLLAAPASPAISLLTNFTKHREMWHCKFMVEKVPTKKVKATLTVTYNLPNLKVSRWCIVAPAPPSSLPMQNITSSSLKVYDVNDKLLAGSEMIQTGSHYMFRSLPKGGGGHKVIAKYEIEAQLFSNKLKKVSEGEFVPSVTGLDPNQRAYHLQPTSLMDYTDPSFAQWVNSNQLHPMLLSDNTVESLLCYAYRVFLFIKVHFSYVYAKDVKGRKASETIGYKCTDCGGFCILFSAIMRMHGIPSRLLFGRWSKTAGEGEQKVHVKGEFYVDGIGWIPFDPASAITGDHVEPYTKFFGNDNGDLVCMHLDHKFTGIETVVSSPQTIEFLQGTSFWVSGDGNFNNQSVVQKWVVEEVK
eukprot:gene6228-7758_t